MPVLHSGGVVQVAFDWEALIIENHHTDNIRRILTINHAHNTSLMLDDHRDPLDDVGHLLAALHDVVTGHGVVRGQ